MASARLITLIAGLAIGGLAFAGPALASDACSPPPDLKPWPTRDPPPAEIARVSTVFYVLTLAWAPEWCRTNGEGLTAQRLDCERTDRGFFLHGLWPNGHGKPYPRYCRPVGGMDVATVRRMYCRTPSAELLQHEWQAHGACGWTRPADYFRQAAALYDQIRPPRLETPSMRPLTAGAVRRAFVARNPRLRADGITVARDDDGRLTEVRICYDLTYRPMACPGRVAPPDETPLRLSPSRTGRF